MASNPQGLAIALKRIAAEKEKRSGFLDLGELGLSEWPEELWELEHLTRLNLGVGWLDERGDWQYAHGVDKANTASVEQGQWQRLSLVERLTLVESDCSSLAFTSLLPNLRALDFSLTQVQDLSPLNVISQLLEIDCSFTRVSDLAPLSALAHLRSLSCAHTSISDISPLVALSSLQSLDCSGTRVSDTSPLRVLSCLQTLHWAGTQIGDLSFLSGLTQLKSVDCSFTQIKDLSPLSLLSELRSLNCSHTQIRELSSLVVFSKLQSLNCSYTQISDLSPLSSLSELQSLDCSHTLLNHISSLSVVSKLRSLECSSTQISDLSPLSSLSELQSLYCSDTEVRDLSSLAALSQLHSLYCSDTYIRDLSPLSSLYQLRSLNCSDTEISELAPLSSLSELEALYCSNTQIKDLSPLSPLSQLQFLDCHDTEISDLSPLSAIAQLKLLDCSNTRVKDLSPVEALRHFESLFCSYCPISEIPGSLIRRESFKTLIAADTSIRHIPNEVFKCTDDQEDGCLEALRAHIRDLEAGDALIPDVKVMVLGNGRIGKTQICNRLRGKPYEAQADSTHGIVVATTDLPIGTSNEPARIHLWDFGGQDIYHSTHALFLRSRAVLLLVWTPGSENSETHEHGGMTFRNQPLPYWLAYIRHLGGPGSPLLVVQNQCDRPEDELLVPPVRQEALATFPFRKLLHYSAREDRGRPALDDTLKEAIRWLRDPAQQGQAKIGIGRLKVKERLVALRTADADTPNPAERKHRTMTQEEYVAICAECGGVSSPRLLLEYLHHSGIAFYKEGIFGDRIILDQAWALDAVYAVFNRERCYPHLRQMNGRFTRTLLEALAWQEHSREEQKLFLSLMQSCGICFEHRPADHTRDVEAEYIAPDLLPEYSEVAAAVEAQWLDDAPGEEIVLELPFLHSGIMRSLLSRIGREAGLTGVYWKDGACLYERTTRSHARVEQQRSAAADTWSGRVLIRTQGGQSATLAAVLEEWALKAARKAGCEVVRNAAGSPTTRKVSRHGVPAPTTIEEAPAPKPALEFAPAPRSGITYGVSYAWGMRVRRWWTGFARMRKREASKFCGIRRRCGMARALRGSCGHLPSGIGCL